MLSFFRRIDQPSQLQQAHFPESAIRRALAERAGRAEPAPGGRTRLLLRAASRRAAGAPAYSAFDFGRRPGAAMTLTTLHAAHMAWRLPWRSALAAWPLV